MQNDYLMFCLTKDSTGTFIGIGFQNNWLGKG